MRHGALLAALMSSAIGCSFIATFDDVDAGAQPVGVEDEPVDSGRRSSSSSGGSNSSSSSSSSSSGTTPVDSGAEVFPPACDEAIDLATVDCANYPRAECGSEPGITGIAPDDLVECNAATDPTCVRHCPHGCSEMPTGFPDQCDDCFGKPDGTYCAADFRWDPKNDVFALECKGGKKVAHTNCQAEGKACATECTTGVAAPSCCQ